MNLVLNFFNEVLQKWGLLLGIISSLFAISTGLRYYRKALFAKKKIENWAGKQRDKYYIETRGQNIDPCENDEINEAEEYSITEKLIPFFINKVFENKIENKYYIILGDSGMGKTTFMIHLFKKYSKKLISQYKIEIIPLFYMACMDMIDKISGKWSTILLLDGLDENKLAAKDYNQFINELLKHTEDFPKVIITCRTQFFPNVSSEPYETGRILLSTSKRKSYFYKMYMSPFNNKEIERYISKKYPYFWRRTKRKKARKIIDKCPHLMVRPMLLSYIDKLIDTDLDYEYIYQIYEHLVESWIDREIIDNKKLMKFTNRTALAMYKKGTIYISSDEISEICNLYDINISLLEAKSKSLLNRNGNGDYKFAHKSIYEFILAKIAFENSGFRLAFNFSTLDMAQVFFNEMQKEYTKNVFSKEIISADLNNMEITNVTFQYRSFNKSQFKKTRFINCTFINCHFNDNDFAKCRFISCEFKNVDMCMEEMKNATFDNCNINNSNFKNALLTDCIFEYTNLNEICFREAKIHSCRFSVAKIFVCNFFKADLDKCQLDGIIADSNDCKEMHTDSDTLEKLSHSLAISSSDRI